jgi:hypothetical protein
VEGPLALALDVVGRFHPRVRARKSKAKRAH